MGQQILFFLGNNLKVIIILKYKLIMSIIKKCVFSTTYLFSQLPAYLIYNYLNPGR